MESADSSADLPADSSADSSADLSADSSADSPADLPADCLPTSCAPLSLQAWFCLYLLAYTFMYSFFFVTWHPADHHRRVETALGSRWVWVSVGVCMCVWVCVCVCVCVILQLSAHHHIQSWALNKDSILIVFHKSFFGHFQSWALVFFCNEINLSDQVPSP